MYTIHAWLRRMASEDVKKASELAEMAIKGAWIVSEGAWGPQRKIRGLQRGEFTGCATGHHLDFEIGYAILADLNRSFFFLQESVLR